MDIDTLVRPVQAHLVFLAARFFGRQDALSHPPVESPTPQALADFAERYGLTIRAERVRLRQIAPEDCPLLLMAASDRAILVMNAREGKFFAVAGETRATLSANALAPHYRGTILRVRLAGEQEEENGDGLSSLPEEMPAASARRRGDGLRLLARHLRERRNRRLLAELCLAALLSHLLMLSVPIFIMAVYDRVIPHLAMETLWALFLGVSLALALDFALRLLRATLTSAVALRAASDAQTSLLSRILRARRQDLPAAPGALMQSIHDIDGVYQMLPNLIVALAVDIPFFFVALLLIHFIGGALAFVPAVAAFSLILFNIVLARRSRSINAQLLRMSSARTNQLAESLGLIDTIRSTGREGALMARWESLIDAHAMAQHRARMAGQAAGVATLFASNATIVATLLAGVHGIAAGNVSVGALVASTMLAGRAIAPLGAQMGLLARLGSIPATMESIAAIENAPSETRGDRSGAPVEAITGAIALRHVAFAYPGGDRPSLGPISLEIGSGEKVALVGRVGCGKTSLMRLVMRFYVPQSGAVLIDGYNACQYDPRFLRRHIGFMAQSAELFEGTLGANLCESGAPPDKARLERVAAATGLRTMIAARKDGYGMHVAPRGANLSGGERQSVALARTLMREAPIYLLDEPTAAMDTNLERHVVREIRPFLEGKTLILATHRLPLLQLVDRIVVMENGRIVSDGPRDALLLKLTEGAGGGGGRV